MIKFKYDVNLPDVHLDRTYKIGSYSLVSNFVNFNTCLDTPITVTIGDLYNVYKKIKRWNPFSDWLIAMYADIKPPKIDIYDERIPNDELIQMYSRKELSIEMLIILFLLNDDGGLEVKYNIREGIWSIYDNKLKVVEFQFGNLTICDYYYWNNLIKYTFKKLGLTAPNYRVKDPKIKEINSSPKSSANNELIKMIV